MNRRAKMDWRLARFIGGVLCLLCLPATVSQAGPVSGAFSETLQLTNDSSDQSEPSISGDYIVWTDARNDANPDDDEDNTDIYLYRISTSVTTQVTNENHEQCCADISGNTIVWEDYRNADTDGDNSDIYKSIIAASGTPGAATAVITQADNQETPTLDGSLLVWEDDRNYAQSETDLYWKNLSTGQSGSYAGAHEDFFPSVSGSRIVWTIMDQSVRPTDFDVYGATVGAAAAGLATGPARQFDATVSGNTAIWADSQSGISRLFMKNLTTQAVQPLGTGTDRDSGPVLSGSLYLYRHCPADTSQPCGLWAGDLTTGRRTLIVTEDPDQGVGEYTLDGNRVVWSYCSGTPGAVFSILNECDIFYGVLNPIVNHPPVADAGESQQVALLGSTVTLNGCGSSDPDGDSLSYTWTKNAVAVENTCSITRASPASQTTETYTLTVSDGQLSASDAVTISWQYATPTLTVTRPAHNTNWIDSFVPCTVAGAPGGFQMDGVATAGLGTTLSTLSISVWKTDYLGVERFQGTFSAAVPAGRTSLTWSACVPSPFMTLAWRAEVTAQSTPAAPTPTKKTIVIDTSGDVKICHILTAAFGRPDHPVIQSLWAAHHRLVGNQWNAPWHQAYMRWYDRVGPQAAAWIADKPWLRVIVRVMARGAATWMERE